MLRDVTNGRVIAEKVDFARGILGRAFGLMFRPKLRGSCLVFSFGKERIIALHMLFVFFPIDVLWLDMDRKVIEMKEGFMPFTFCTPKRKAGYVIELPEGAISRSSIRTGHRMDW